MTHTAGFEEVARDLFVSDAAHMHSLEQFLKHHVPDRIFPPGVIPAYSNYATALAGYIVQRVSGKPFDQYVQDNIYTPLEMQRSTFVQPLPDNLKPMMSNGYKKASEKAQPFEFVEAYPAGSVSTTARDMCNFMIAHLQNGQFGDKQILKPETAKLMHSRLFGTDDRLNAMAHGFYEESRNGQRIIGHGGDTQFFHSDLHLILDKNVEFFVSYNSAGKGETSARTLLFESFLDRYFPFTPPAGAKVDSAAADAKQIAGSYKSSRRFDTSFLSLTTPLGEPKVIPHADGTISVDPLKDASGQLKKYEEISPFLYREVHGQDKIGFKKDAAGNWQFQLDYPFFIFQVGLAEQDLQYCRAFFRPRCSWSDDLLCRLRQLFASTTETSITAVRPQAPSPCSSGLYSPPRFRVGWLSVLSLPTARWHHGLPLDHTFESSASRAPAAPFLSVSMRFSVREPDAGFDQTPRSGHCCRLSGSDLVCIGLEPDELQRSLLITGLLLTFAGPPCNETLDGHHVWVERRSNVLEKPRGPAHRSAFLGQFLCSTNICSDSEDARGL